MFRLPGLFRRLTVVGAMFAVCGGLILGALVMPSAGAASRPRLAGVSDCASQSISLAVGLSAHAKLVSESDVPVCVTGRVTVTFAGDQAAGCAAHGLCAYSGTDVWEPAGAGDIGITTVAQNGRRSTGVTLAIGGFSTPVMSSVQRSGAGGLTAACSDRVQTTGGFFGSAVNHGQVDLRLDQAQPPFLGTRCAGPLDRDLAAALPDRTVSLARLRRGHIRISLAGSAPFTAGGFSGTVDSTVTLALGAPRTQPRHVVPPPESTPMRSTTVRYRLSHVSGAVTAAVRTSAAAAVCGPVDACGLRGAISITPLVRQGGSAFLTASAPERRPERDVRTALGLGSGGNPSGVFVGGAGEVASGGSVSAEVTQGGDTCTDHVALQQTAIVIRRHADRLIVTVVPSSQAADPLRTRCPGPALGRDSLASASLPLDVLRHPRLTINLHGVSFQDGPYDVATRSTLTVRLQRRGVKTQIIPFLSRSRVR